MISRHWRGLVRKGKADDYIRHLDQETFPKLSGIAGFVRAYILRHELPAGTEFLIVTEWESLDAIQKFAGSDSEAAVVPAVAEAMMVEYDARVRHYEMVKTYAR